MEEYRQALNFVALNYPNSEEGKTAEKMLAVNIPKLQALELGNYPSENWKILYVSKDFEDKSTKTLIEKITKFIKERSMGKLSLSQDIYTMTDNFVVIHGLKSEEYAKGIASILKEVKEYKIQETPIIICTENYSIVQIKKNLDDYLSGNLAENPQKPNWDGTFERPQTAQQEAPKQERNVEAERQAVQEQKKQETQRVNSNRKGGERKLNADENRGNALPPSPQCEPKKEENNV